MVTNASTDWVANSRVTAQATVLRSRGRTDIVASVGVVRRRTRGSQTSRATTASTDQDARPPRQPPAIVPIGTVAAAPIAAPSDRIALYAPVTSPIRSGKSALTTTGTSTFAVAIPAQARKVPASSVLS